MGDSALGTVERSYHTGANMTVVAGRGYDQRLGTMPLPTAILVPNTRIAYLARIACGQFGEEYYRVFYNDMGRALKWLERTGSDPGVPSLLIKRCC